MRGERGFLKTGRVLDEWKRLPKVERRRFSRRWRDEESLEGGEMKTERRRENLRFEGKDISTGILLLLPYTVHETRSESRFRNECNGKLEVSWDTSSL